MTSPTPQVDPGEKIETKTPEDRRLEDSSILRDRSPDSQWQRYITAVRLGMTKGDCADYAGIGSATVRLWRTNAEDDEAEGKTSVFTEFFAEVNANRAQMVSRNLATIEKARQSGDWKAASCVLERHGYSKQLEVTGAVEANLTYTMDEQDLGA